MTFVSFVLQTYDEMEDLISQSDGRSVDVFISDAVTKPKEGEVDAYNAIRDDDYDIRLLPFGKGTENPGKKMAPNIISCRGKNKKVNIFFRFPVFLKTKNQRMFMTVSDISLKNVELPIKNKYFGDAQIKVCTR